MGNVTTWEFIVGLLYVLGGLGIFLFGMRVMSEGIQKVAGEGMRRIMATMTQNRFFGLLTGLLVTCLVQSSSATTVMVVSFVNAQLLTLMESIGVIMGANLGTTLTGWIIATIGKFSLSKIALPIIGIGLPLVFMSKPKFKHTGEFLVGFGLLFFGLSELKNAVPDVKSLLKSADPGDQELVASIQGVIEQLNSYGFGSVIIFLVIGVFLTILVQSSSAAMGITIIVAINGWINFEIAAAIVLGENIGTTVTAWLASIGANLNAKRAARAHFIFNIAGLLDVTPLLSLHWHARRSYAWSYLHRGCYPAGSRSLSLCQWLYWRTIGTGSCRSKKGDRGQKHPATPISFPYALQPNQHCSLDRFYPALGSVSRTHRPAQD